MSHTYIERNFFMSAISNMLYVCKNSILISIVCPHEACTSNKRILQHSEVFIENTHALLFTENILLLYESLRDMKS